MPKGPKSDEWTEKHEVASGMGSERGGNILAGYVVVLGVRFSVRFMFGFFRSSVLEV